MEGNNTDEVLSEEYYDPLLDDISLDEILGEKNATAPLDNTSNLSAATAPPTGEEIGEASLVTAPLNIMPGEGSKERRQQGRHSDQEVSDHLTTTGTWCLPYKKYFL